MDAPEDDDILLQKASATLIADLISLLDIILWKPPNKAERKRHVHRVVRRRDLEKAVALVFQTPSRLVHLLSHQ